MPYPVNDANPQPQKKGFFASLFARHTTRASSAEKTAPQPAQPAPEPQAPVKHPLQDQIDALLARLSGSLSGARFHNAGSKQRDVLNHQYRQALGAYRRAGSEKDRETATDVLTVILVRLQALDEETRGIAAIAQGGKPPANKLTNDLGFVTKALGEEYAGETLQRGWREGVQAPPEGTVRREIWMMMKACTLDAITEAGWSDAKRTQRELKIEADGTVGTEDGHDYDSYVLDPQSGKTYLFKENEVARRPLGAEEIKALETTLAEVEALERDFHDSLKSKKFTPEVLEVASRVSSLVDRFRACKDEPERESVRAQINAMKPELEQIRQETGIDLYQIKLDMVYIKSCKERLRNAIGSRVVGLGTHHSSPLDGKPVAGGGTVAIENGRITQISNISGHYKPLFVHLAQTIEHLLRQGALLDKTLSYIDHNGKGQRLDANPELKALYDEVSFGLPGLEQLKKDAAALIEQLDALPRDLDEQQRKAKQTALDEQLREIRQKMEPIEHGLHVLQKLGTGPANKPSDARVVFLDNIQNKTGLQIHLEQLNATDKPTVQEFLASGGAHKVFKKNAPNAAPNPTPYKAEPSDGAPAKGAYTDKTVVQAKAAVLEQIRTRKTKEGLEVRKKLDEQADKLLDTLRKAMGDAAFAEFIDANKAPSIEDIKRALARLQAQPASEPARESADMPSRSDPPASGSGVGYRWSDPNAPAATGKPSLSAYQWGGKDRENEHGETAKPGAGATTGYAPLKLDESGAVTAESSTGYVPVPRDDESVARNRAAEKHDRGFPIPQDFIQQVEQKYKGKVKKISGRGLNCYIRSILTGVSNAGWRPQPPQTLESVIADVAAILQAEGLREPDGLIDAGGRDGARVRDLVRARTGVDLWLRIVTWDKTNARVTAFDMTTGALKLTLVNTPGHFDLLA